MHPGWATHTGGQTRVGTEMKCGQGRARAISRGGPKSPDDTRVPRLTTGPRKGFSDA
jgi:hypothetical protein